MRLMMSSTLVALHISQLSGCLWFGAVAYGAEPDLPPRLWEDLRLRMWAPYLPSAQKRTVTKEVDALRKVPDIRMDSDSRAAFHALELKLVDFQRGRLKGERQKIMRGLLVALATIPTRWPGSNAAVRANKRMLLCEKELE